MKQLSSENIFRFTLILLLFGCQRSPDSSGAVDKQNLDGLSTFVAHPQPIPEQEVKTLSVGASAPDFQLPDVNGRMYSLKDFEKAQALVIIFTCNHCPTAQAYENRIIALHKDYQSKSVAVVAISPNSPLGLLYEELGYSDLGDTYQEMQQRAKDLNFTFPYLYDGDTHTASLQYGPVATPQVFVFDKERKLQYVGRLDGSEKPGSANAEDVRTTIDALLANQPVPVSETKSFGCSTKWAWKTEYKKKVEEEWKQRTVSLQNISAQEIRSLVKNSSDKLMLINVWATWCGPCIIEYPEFIQIHRMFQGRDFEFVSISADKMKARDKALEFLKEKISAVRNYLYSEEDTYELIEAIDPEWNGALPYTVLIEPGGKKVYTKQGPIDAFALRRVIVEHPMIGRYY